MRGESDVPHTVSVDERKWKSVSNRHPTRTSSDGSNMVRVQSLNDVDEVDSKTRVDGLQRREREREGGFDGFDGRGPTQGIVLLTAADGAGSWMMSAPDPASIQRVACRLAIDFQ